MPSSRVFHKGVRVCLLHILFLREHYLLKGISKNLVHDMDRFNFIKTCSIFWNYTSLILNPIAKAMRFRLASSNSKIFEPHAHSEVFRDTHK